MTSRLRSRKTNTGTSAHVGIPPQWDVGQVPQIVVLYETGDSAASGDQNNIVGNLAIQLAYPDINIAQGDWHNTDITAWRQ